MITEDILSQIIQDQGNYQNEKGFITRDRLVPLNTRRIVIISGIRRCGKSTFLRQLFDVRTSLAVNFEDPRLEGFDLNDFRKLESIAKKDGKGVLLFDEVQNIPEWEKYARSAHDRNVRLYITGSNASMLSKELGTRLTGRYLQIELFPFGYREFLTFQKQPEGLVSLNDYLQLGGFPEYLIEQNTEYLRTLMRDILMRDIAVRRDIRNEHLLIRLAVHILSNVSKEFSYNNITRNLEIRSVRTTIDYCDYLKECYLIDLVPRFSFSIRQQIANSKKAYCIDTAMARANSLSLTGDTGRLLENTVFLQLRRKFSGIYYYKNDINECDFVIMENHKVCEVFQVCLKIDENNMKREIAGIKAAMNETKCKKGTIITLDQEDELDGIPLVPAWKWMMQ